MQPVYHCTNNPGPWQFDTLILQKMPFLVTPSSRDGRVSDTEIAKTATDDTGRNSHRPKIGLPRIRTTKLQAPIRILHELAK